MLQPGDRIGRYEIRDAIGEGGFGRVYRAWDPELERQVAVKELSSERKASAPDQYAEYLERFKLERQVQGQFQDGDEYLVEELVEGPTLRDLIRQDGPLPPGRVIQIGIEMCQAIAAAWEQDVVHRDIKPSNILLSSDDQAKLSDFGVAQIGQVSQRTQSDNHHPGTPAYMSPEQERGYGYLDERSDLYALGLVLYKALTGKTFKRERVPVRQLATNVPKELEKVIMQALARDPTERYQRSAEFEAALRSALDRPRPMGLWWVGGALVLLPLLWLIAYPLWLRARFVPTETATPTVTAPLSPTPVRPNPTSRPTSTPTTTPTPTATPTVTATPPPTPLPTVSTPRLISPSGAATVKASPLTLQWESKLPGSDYGFRVSLHHGGGKLSHISPVLDDTRWTVDLPGSGEAKDAVGGWRWSVAVVRREDTPEVVARSNEWTFYYDPFGGSGDPSHSPLPTPLFTSPLSVPAP